MTLNVMDVFALAFGPFTHRSISYSPSSSFGCRRLTPEDMVPRLRVCRMLDRFGMLEAGLSIWIQKEKPRCFPLSAWGSILGSGWVSPRLQPQPGDSKPRKHKFFCPPDQMWQWLPIVPNLWIVSQTLLGISPLSLPVWWMMPTKLTAFEICRTCLFS